MINKLSNTQQVIPLETQVTEKIPRETIEKEVNGHQENRLKGHSKEQLEKIVNSMNDFLKPSNTHLKFEFHEKLKEYYVTIIDDSINEVIKEIPHKKILDMYAEMTEFLGILVDKKV